jgi:hypothetical protein
MSIDLIWSCEGVDGLRMLRAGEVRGSDDEAKRGGHRHEHENVEARMGCIMYARRE